MFPEGLLNAKMGTFPHYQLLKIILYLKLNYSRYLAKSLMFALKSIHFDIH